MQLSQIERTLQEMIEKEEAAEALARKQRWSISRLLRRWTFNKDNGRKTDRRGDFVIAGLGITLGLVCALFPWYIFFNPDQFGIQALKFGDGDGQGTTRRAVASISHTLQPTDALTETGAPFDKLDFFPTGTLPGKQEALAAPNQPFPAEDLPYRLVHVMNGRALIEDETGLWVVQSGAILPDSSRVASIEQRGGNWVLVTSKEKVVELSH